METVSRRLVPVVCFNCGMPVNNKQQTYDERVRAGDAPEAIFEALDVRRSCCRIVLSRSAEDSRLDRPLPQRETFVHVHYASRLDAAPFTVRADGSTDLIDDSPDDAAS